MLRTHTLVRGTAQTYTALHGTRGNIHGMHYTHELARSLHVKRQSYTALLSRCIPSQQISICYTKLLLIVKSLKTSGLSFLLVHCDQYQCPQIRYRTRSEKACICKKHAMCYDITLLCLECSSPRTSRSSMRHNSINFTWKSAHAKHTYVSGVFAVVQRSSQLNITNDSCIFQLCSVLLVTFHCVHE